MKNVLTLSNHIFVWIFKSFFIKMAVFSVILQIILFWMKIGLQINKPEPSFVFLPYEALLSDSGITILLFVGFISVFAVILCHGVSLRRNHKPIYTILTLPMPRTQIYIAFFLSGLTLLLAFMALQALLLMLWYIPITNIVNTNSMEVILRLEDGRKVTGMDSAVNNGLFLAFQRDPILRMLFPSTLLGFFNIVVLILMILSQCYGFIFDLRESKLDLLKIVAMVGLWFAFAVTEFLLTVETMDKESIIMICVAFVVWITIMSFMSINNIKRGEGGEGR